MRHVKVLLAGIMFLLMASGAHAFIPATFFEETVTPTVTYDKGQSTFNYSYTINNSPSSQQDIQSFGVGYLSSGLGTISSPANWRSSREFSDLTMVHWYSRNEATDILAGRQQSGYAFQHTGLPSIRTYFAQSSYIYSPLDDAEIYEIEAQGKTDYFNDSKRGKTIGPGAATLASDASAIIEHIIAQKHQAADLSWIVKSGIVTSLDQKLDSALAAVKRGENKTARNILGAFENEVQAQTGKSINANAAQILRTCADVAIQKL